MSDVAKMKNIEFVQAMDRANLSKHESHTLMGYRIVDTEARDPITKKILFDDNGSGKLQSRQYCFPVKMVFCRETKIVVAVFNDVFEHSKDCASDDRNPLKDQGYLKFTITSACDMALLWKGLETGGGLGCLGVITLVNVVHSVQVTLQFPMHRLKS